MKKWLLLILICTLGACATSQVVPAGQQDFLFPEGRYQQEVVVDVMATHPPQNFDFDCFLQKKPEETLLVGYNSFGFSLFTIREKLGQPVEAESSVAQIQQHKDFFIKIFNLVKAVIAIRRGDPRLQKNRIQLDEQGLQANVTFSNFDKLGIPLQMTLETKGQYRVAIKTNSYKLRTETARH